jgi:hypothetical protein
MRTLIIILLVIVIIILLPAALVTVLSCAGCAGCTAITAVALVKGDGTDQEKDGRNSIAPAAVPVAQKPDDGPSDEEIAAAKRKEEEDRRQAEIDKHDEEAAERKYKAAIKQIANGTLDEIENAKKDLAAIVKIHSNTKAAKKAADLLKQMQ